MIAPVTLVGGSEIGQSADREDDITAWERLTVKEQPKAVDQDRMHKLKPGQEIRIEGKVLKREDGTIKEKNLIECAGELSWKGIDPPDEQVRIILWEFVKDPPLRVIANESSANVIVKDAKLGKAEWRGSVRANGASNRNEEYFLEVRPRSKDQLNLYGDSYAERVRWTQRLTIQPVESSKTRDGEARP